jgi:hypothetical protein
MCGGDTALVKFDGVTAVNMKNTAFGDVAMCGSYTNRRFGLKDFRLTLFLAR